MTLIGRDIFTTDDVDTDDHKRGLGVPPDRGDLRRLTILETLDPRRSGSRRTSDPDSSLGPDRLMAYFDRDHHDGGLRGHHAEGEMARSLANLARLGQVYPTVLVARLVDAT